MRPQLTFSESIDPPKPAPNPLASGRKQQFGGRRARGIMKRVIEMNLARSLPLPFESLSGEGAPTEGEANHKGENLLPLLMSAKS